MSDIECPYCGERQEHDFEQGDPGKLHHTECYQCDKRFVFNVEWSPHFYPRKADCLNGGEHKWHDRLAHEDLSKPEDWYYRKYFSVLRECVACEKDERVPVKKSEAPDGE